MAKVTNHSGKHIFIGLMLIVIIGLLVYIAVKPQILVTQPEQQIIPEQPTPKAEEGTPTPKATETTPTAPGTQQSLFPQEITFWVNSIRIQSLSTSNFIPVPEDDVKTFAGSFGPYFDEPEGLQVVLCSELSKVTAAPSCETVPTIYKDRYVSFARGYDSDEYIGGMAAKDYLAYYTIYHGDTIIGKSPTANIRTVKD